MSFESFGRWIDLIVHLYSPMAYPTFAQIQMVHENVAIYCIFLTFHSSYCMVCKTWNIVYHFHGDLAFSLHVL